MTMLLYSVCCGLNLKCPSWAHLFDCFIPASYTIWKVYEIFIWALLEEVSHRGRRGEWALRYHSQPLLPVLGLLPECGCSVTRQPPAPDTRPSCYIFPTMRDCIPLGQPLFSLKLLVRISYPRDR